MPGTNIQMLQQVAAGLGALKDEVVFVGGSVAELYASEPELSDIRPTIDVDCVIEIRTYREYGQLEEELRRLGFRNDMSEGAPVCRWIYNGITVDVMPTDPDVIGFTNRWYPEGIRNKIEIVLPDTNSIYILSPEYYIATKFDAHHDRGGDDLRTSHDFEDIIYILDNNDNVTELIRNNSSIELKRYLKEQCTSLMDNENILESIECALPLGSEDERVDYIYEIISDIASVAIDE